MTIPLCLTLVGPNLIDGHDSTAGLIRALSMDRYMGHGQFLVRWSPEVNWGYGYPMFNFYPPFFSFVSALFFKIVQNMTLSINLACFFFWILSGIGMFLLAREYWGNEGGMLSSILYVYAPYHIIDLYVRGAFAEFSSFAFFPFILFSILKLSRKVSLGIFLLGIVNIFALSVAHNIMSMLFFPIAFAYIFYLYFTSNRSSWIITAISMFIIGLMLSSFFWFPAIIEKQYLNLNFLLTKHFDYHENFLSIRKLFWPFKVWTMDHISFQVGVIHTILCISLLAVVNKIFKINKFAVKGIFFFLIVSLFGIFFTLPYSHPLWEHINILNFIQFPWRILTIITFCMSFLCGGVFLLINDNKFRIIFLILIGLLAIIFYYQSSRKPVFLKIIPSVENFLALGDGEYTPKWVTIPPDKRPDQKFEIVQGKGQLGTQELLNQVNYKTHVTALEQSLLCFHTFYFPGWHVFIDGQKTQPNLDNPFGLILFSVPAGEHDIQVVFGTTFIRTIGIIISWLGVLFLFFGIIWIKKTT